MTGLDNSDWDVDRGGFRVMPEAVVEQIAAQLPEQTTASLRDYGHDQVLARWQSQFVGITELPLAQQPDYAAALALKAFDLGFEIAMKSIDQKTN
ncbi:MAG: hypothetical protein ABI221_00575 [Candidatus Saccharimonadales bacterium]